MFRAVAMLQAHKDNKTLSEVCGTSKEGYNENTQLREIIDNTSYGEYL